MRVFKFSVLAFCLLLLAIISSCSFILLNRPLPPKHHLLINATVLTMNQDNDVAEAIAVNNDKIVAVGSTEEILKLKQNNSLVTDLSGKTLLPGFIDTHSHFPGLHDSDLMVDLNSPPIGSIKTIDAAIKKLKKAALTKEDNQWIIGFGYDDTGLKEKRHINRWDLDKVSTTQPIYLLHISGHFAVTNSLGLKLAGITKNTPNPKGGVIQRDKEGFATGVLEETATKRVEKIAMDFSFSEFKSMIQSGVNAYAKAGITTVQSGLTRKQYLNALAFMSWTHVIAQRVMVWPDKDLGLEWAEGEFSPNLYQNRHFTIGAVKLVADGSIQGYTAYLQKPYYKQNNQKPDYRGYPKYPLTQFTNIIKKLHCANLQVAVHGNGDQAIEDIITAIAQAQKACPQKDPRHIIVHAQMAHDDQLIKMKKLGITPNFFSAHTYYWGDRHRDIFLGQQRAERISPTASAEAIDLKYTLHLDTPVVPMQPMTLLWSTVNRQTSSNKVLGKEQSVPVIEALKAITIDAAWQVFQQDNRGSIEVNKYADLVVLDKNPLLHPTTLDKIKVEKTIVGGVEVYSRGTEK